MHIATLLDADGDLRAKARCLATDPDSPFPVLTAKFKLTWRCNLACAMCRLWRESAARGRGGAPSLDPARVGDALCALRERGLRKVHFSGGEVLLYDGFREVAAHARALDLQVNLTTNGTLITKDLARFFVEERVHTVTVSVDGADGETHDRIRGVKGAFKATMDGIDRILRRKEQKGRGPKIGVNTVVSAATIDRLDAVYRLLRERRIDGWRILPIDTRERGLRPTREQWRALFEKLPAWRHLLWRPPMDWSSERSGRRAEGGKYAGVFYGNRICYAPWFNVFVDADGRVYPCCSGKRDMRPVGNLNTTGIADILASAGLRDIRYTLAAGHRFAVCDCCDDFLEENQAFHRVRKDSRP